MIDTSGPMSRQPFAYFDHGESFWRMSQGTFPWASDMFSQTWPSWGSLRNGAVFGQPTSVPRTAGTGCSSLLLLPTPMVSSSKGGTATEIALGNPKFRLEAVSDWGQYGPAIDRWAKLTRPNPPATMHRTGKQRLNPFFIEWMMGLPEGWVTMVPRVPLSRQIEILGNGVVPQQAAWMYAELSARLEGDT